MIDFYNEQAASFARHARAAGSASFDTANVEAFIDYSPTRYSWNHVDKLNVARGVTYIPSIKDAGASPHTGRSPSNA
jgi:hypothetical protein